MVYRGQGAPTLQSFGRDMSGVLECFQEGKEASINAASIPSITSTLYGSRDIFGFRRRG